MSEQFAMPHKLVLNERKLLTVTGVTEVVSFDDATVIAHTEQGTLGVQGKDLQLKTLLPEGGQVTVEGTIATLMYEEPRPAGSLWQRLLR
jgi:sporulation protein YabP